MVSGSKGGRRPEGLVVKTLDFEKQAVDEWAAWAKEGSLYQRLH
jgi:hypothetical protein